MDTRSFKEGVDMAKKRVVCSFDFENDKSYYYLLKAWNNNPYIDFYISDCTPSEIQSQSVSTIKQVLSKKIGEARYMVAIIGDHSSDQHPNHKQIGYNNWQAYEIDKNAQKGNGLVIVKIKEGCVVPDEAFGQNAKWIIGFDKDKITRALNELAYGM